MTTPTQNITVESLLDKIGKQDEPYPVELQDAKRGEFVKQVKQYNADRGRFWNTPSRKKQLEDAGFGSFGPM